MPNPLTILIPAQFNGPPGSANGGVSAGLAASRIDGPAEVSLRAPPPLDESMDMVKVEDGYDIHHGDQLVMTARPAAPLAPPPQAPDYELARSGPDRFPPAETHAFRTAMSAALSARKTGSVSSRAGPTAMTA